ncbi:methyl-accepting chemotaxis protein [Pullulanibacillus pueri]|uniref:histidine kinase n=1 Tax=Pullulanibacillus pueri TaxID=1437324 RepID=A0A8J3EMK6_9BACL|nr:methyl-accepting chemotaxis protein [Pullulanibacillus pueri]MBM7682790.1 methyl-accepting chemotaxis protein [Pullulanibacillus pueri]GGH83194.1 hypothetical protein GCM10007096_23700 [Pullulanibacillus pueri]
MNKKKKDSTLRKQFILRMFSVFIIIVVISGTVQSFYLAHKVNKDVNDEALSIGHSVEQGIAETDLASKAIEHQLDLKLKLIAQRISDRLTGRQIGDISNTDLKRISKEFGIAGITLFARQDDDIVGVKSTEKNDIGFSFKKTVGADDSGFIGLNHLLDNQQPTKNDESYVDHDTMILYTSQSGSHEGKPVFYKYAYYHNKNQDFIINPYIEANEVYQFTDAVGPDSWAKKVVETNPLAKEVAVLDPSVYANPKLAKQMYPPLQKVVYGTFKEQTKKDTKLLKEMAKHPKQVSYIEKKQGTKIYKMFIPMKDGKVIYVALNYTKMSAPLHNLSFILIAFSVISLLALFILTARFFSSIYKNIQDIIKQIMRLEGGDFTAESEVKGKGELAELSTSTNHMVRTLNQVLKDTTKQAEKVQALSLDLQKDADESVERMYALSLDLTTKARDDHFEITDFLDSLEAKVLPLKDQEGVQDILRRIEDIRKISNDRSSSTTDITLTLSDLLNSLQVQSAELSNISSTLFKNMYKFKL